MIKLAYVVPTKDRRTDLKSLLTSLQRQTVKPDQLIIVDGSEIPIQDLFVEFKDLEVTYVRVFPPGLSKQRNAGMAALRPDITVAGYLDDDVVLESDSTEKMKHFWEHATPEIGGAAFMCANQPRARSPRLARFFLLDDPTPGVLLSSSFQSQIPPVRSTCQTDWLYGGSTLWRREVIEKFKFDEWFIGTGYLEDVDYSYRVRQSYKLFVVSDAIVFHYSHPIQIQKNFVLGKHQVLNRFYFFQKMNRDFNRFNLISFAWGVFGQFLFNVAASILRVNSAGFRRALGNLSGLFILLTRGTHQVSGHYK